MTQPVFRFAPSPNGRLHLGHAYSALLNADLAARWGGRFLLRIEDIDVTRCRPEFEDAIYDDLAWLGLSWETPVRRQSEHFAAYGAATERLKERGILYRCFCTRTAIAAVVARKEAVSGEVWPCDPDAAPLYPGTCRELSRTAGEERARAGVPHAWRLDMDVALRRASGPHRFTRFAPSGQERFQAKVCPGPDPDGAAPDVIRGRHLQTRQTEKKGDSRLSGLPEIRLEARKSGTPDLRDLGLAGDPSQSAQVGNTQSAQVGTALEQMVTADPGRWGDAVIVRKEIPTSYHLSVVLDDALQGVTHVVRGVDLEAATDLHVLLQALLDLRTPAYHHHRLIRDDEGGKLSKRVKSQPLADLRRQGVTADEIKRALGFAPE